MLQCTIAGGRTKEANEKSFVFVHQHGSYDVAWKPSITEQTNGNMESIGFFKLYKEVKKLTVMSL